jgi:hypothetical protein
LVLRTRFGLEKIALRIIRREFVVLKNVLGKSSVIKLRTFAWLIAVIGASVMLQTSRTHAQWWSHAPVDFEECADAAEKATTREAKSAALTECNAKFAGRRKPGGGYTYYDFMQNRNFDIAGPNPTPEEQKQIDEQYTAFLDQERRNSIAAAFTAKQQQLQQASLRDEKASPPEKASMPEKTSPPEPSARPVAAAATEIRPRAKTVNCARHSTTFSCEWPRLSESINNLKKVLFGSATSGSASTNGSTTTSKAKRG